MASIFLLSSLSSEGTGTLNPGGGRIEDGRDASCEAISVMMRANNTAGSRLASTLLRKASASSRPLVRALDQA